MATPVKYNIWCEDLGKKVHNVFGTADTWKVALTNRAPVVATDVVLADITELSAGSGYTAGGIDIQNDGTRSGATLTVAGVDVVFTAAGGTIGPFRYAVLYNATPSSPLKPLIASWDYGSNITLQDTQTFTVDIGSLLTLV